MGNKIAALTTAVGIGEVINLPNDKTQYVVVSAKTCRIPEGNRSEYYSYQEVVLRTLIDGKPQGENIPLELGGYIDPDYKVRIVAKNAKYYTEIK